MSVPSKAKILVVEDERLIALDVTRRLTRLGYTVVASVASGEEAIQTAGAMLPDIVLMDICLKQNSDGIEAAAAIGSTLDIPVIFTTGNADSATVERARAAQSYGYLVKPFKDSDLSAGIEIALAKHDNEQRLKEHEKQLERSQTELKRLAQHLQEVREVERRQLAREVHDELGQVLTALKMETAVFQKKLAQEEVSRSLELDMESMLRLVDCTITSVRRIVTELRPEVLDELGIGEALVYLAEEFQARWHIPCTVNRPRVVAALDQLTATALFRICQEALTNVARHAGARRVDITLGESHQGLSLTVSDDGRGLPGDVHSKRESFGLIGIRERAELLGGTLSLSSTPHQGTTLSVWIPFNQDNAVTFDIAEQKND